MQTWDCKSSSFFDPDLCRCFDIYRLADMQLLPFAPFPLKVCDLPHSKLRHSQRLDTHTIAVVQRPLSSLLRAVTRNTRHKIAWSAPSRSLKPIFLLLLTFSLN